MPRRTRSFHPGLYHLAPRASDTRYLFENDVERQGFLLELARTLERFEIALVAYTLMGTHYHLVVDSPGTGIAPALQRLHTWYARMANSVRERAAHLFRAHYFARELTSEEDLLTVCHYVAHNPVEAALVREPFAWPWSSAAATAGLARPQVALKLEPIRLAFGGRPDWQRRYQAFVAAPWQERSDA
jgi:REP element-mobilizing transposase RayT